MTTGRNGPQMWRFRCRTLAENGTLVLVLEGRLGFATANELKERVEEAANASKEVVLDLSEVDYLSSASLRVIEGLAAAHSSGGGTLTLRAPSPAARLSLELAGMIAMLR